MRGKAVKEEWKEEGRIEHARMSRKTGAWTCPKTDNEKSRQRKGGDWGGGQKETREVRNRVSALEISMAERRVRKQNAAKRQNEKNKTGAKVRRV